VPSGGAIKGLLGHLIGTTGKLHELHGVPS